MWRGWVGVCECLGEEGPSKRDGRPRSASTRRCASVRPRPPYVIWPLGAGAAGGAVAATVRRPRRRAGRPPCPDALSCAGSGGDVPGSSRRIPDTGACPCPVASWRPHRRPCLQRPPRHQYRRLHRCRRQRRFRLRPCGAIACGTPDQTSCGSSRYTWRTRSATVT